MMDCHHHHYHPMIGYYINTGLNSIAKLLESFIDRLENLDPHPVKIWAYHLNKNKSKAEDFEYGKVSLREVYDSLVKKLESGTIIKDSPVYAELESLKYENSLLKCDVNILKEQQHSDIGQSTEMEAKSLTVKLKKALEKHKYSNMKLKQRCLLSCYEKLKQDLLTVLEIHMTTESEHAHLKSEISKLSKEKVQLLTSIIQNSYKKLSLVEKRFPSDMVLLEINRVKRFHEAYRELVKESESLTSLVCSYNKQYHANHLAWRLEKERFIHILQDMESILDSHDSRRTAEKGASV